MGYNLSPALLRRVFFSHCMSIAQPFLNNLKKHPSLPFITLILSICVVSLNTGLTIPYTTFKLKYLGATDFIIGLMAATPALGIVIMAFFANAIAKRFSIKSLFVASTALLTLSILPLAYVDHFTLIFLLRLTAGIASSLLIILGETCVNDLAGDHDRGRIVAIYTTFFTICQILGPFILSMLGAQGGAALWLLFAFHLIGLAITMWAPLDFAFHEKQKHSKSLFYFVRTVPVIILAIFLFAFFDAAVLSIMPLYSIEHGYSERLAVLIVSMIFIGDACFQIPFGWLSDAYGRVRIHVLCAVGTLLLTIMIPFLMPYPIFLWPTLFLWGGFAGSIYTLGLVRVGDYFTGPNLVAANACLGLVWGLGGLVAPMMSMGLMHYLGSNGLIIGIALMTVLFLLSFGKKVKLEA